MLTLFNFLKCALIFSYVIVVLETNSVSSIKVNHDEVKSHIFKWWQQNSIQTPIKCVETNDVSRPKLKFLDYLATPKIRAFTCNNGTAPKRYLFTGLNKTHFPDGKGRLKVISNSEWLSWSESEQSNFTESNICYDLIELNKIPVMEIIGTIKN